MAKKLKTESLSDLDVAILEWCECVAESEHTRIAYSANLREFLNGRDYLTITIQDIREWQSYLQRQGKNRPAESTIARKVAAVRSFYRFLNREEKTALNLGQLDKIKIIREVDHHKLLTEGEVKAILRAAEPDPVVHLFIRFLYITAARKSEALGLCWRDLEALEEGGQANIYGKGKKHRRTYLPPELWADLMKSRGHSDVDDRLFPSLTPLSAWQIIKQLGKVAKIDKPVSPHSFRHAHLSHALKHGASIVEARDQAGHSSINTTSLYLHADSERATANRLKVK